jgi:hypothetical protein
MSRCPTCGARAGVSDAEIREIRERYAAGTPQPELADTYDLTQPAISNIVRGLRRPDAGGPIAVVRVRNSRRRD